MNFVGQIHNHASSDYNLLKQILDFDIEGSDPGSTRKSLITSLWAAYDPAFQVLHQWISFSVRKSTDFSRLETQARGVVQTLMDEAAKLKGELAASKKEADTTLDHIRKTAAEQGVSQQATYFKTAADEQTKNAKNWLVATVISMALFVLFAIASFWIHKIPALTPTTTYETIQIATSKLLVFAMLTFNVYLCARNYQSTRHNAVVNRHRQDALATFNALVDATDDPRSKDIVLNHAAGCIFLPQPTGYSKEGAGSDSPSAKSVVELLGPLAKAGS